MLYLKHDFSETGFCLRLQVKSSHDFSETGFCLRLQVKSSHMDRIERANLSPDTNKFNYISSADDNK
jgi:hypothetical protein